MSDNVVDLRPRRPEPPHQSELANREAQLVTGLLLALELSPRQVEAAREYLDAAGFTNVDVF